MHFQKKFYDHKTAFHMLNIYIAAYSLNISGILKLNMVWNQY